MHHDNNDSHNVNGYHNKNGKFAPGNPGKPKGSSKNRLRDKLKNFIDEKLEQLPEWFVGLSPKEKIEVVISLMPYCLPRLQGITEMDIDGDQKEASIDYSKLSEPTLKELLANTQTLENEN
jgi:hypothetical protein